MTNRLLAGAPDELDGSDRLVGLIKLAGKQGWFSEMVADANFYGAVVAAEQFQVAALLLVVNIEQQAGIGTISKQWLAILKQHVAALDIPSGTVGQDFTVASFVASFGVIELGQQEPSR